MSTITPEDIATVCKLLERLRTGETNLIPSVADAAPRNPAGKSEAMLQRVEELLSAHLRRMQEPVGDGGPAFQTHPPSITDMARRIHGEPGMSLRDFFIAHAPAEPQPWFKPVMSTERPKEPTFPDGGTAEQRSYVREFLDVMSPDEAGTPALREYIVAYRSGRDAAFQWDAEAKKQLYVQWPAAWADAMLRARSGS